MAKIMLFLGAINMALGVGLGAFGAHTLKGRLSESMLAVYHTGVQYHLLHALGLLIVGLVMLHAGQATPFRWAAYLLLAGIALFSGSLYVLALGGPKWIGVLTPFGGFGFITAWIAVAIGVWKNF